MPDPARSSISAPYPRVREACESCHRRKIRCLLTPGSPACQSCLSSGDSCLFAPRAKAGRPRRTHSEKLQRRKLCWQAVDTNHSRTPEARYARPSTELLGMVAADELQFGAVMAFDNYWDHDKMAGMQGLEDSALLANNAVSAPGGVKMIDIDFLGHNSTPREASLVQHSVQHLAPQDGREAQILCDEGQQDPVYKDGSLGRLSPSHSSTPQYDIFAPVNESLDFEAALKLCGDLDRFCCTLRDREAGGMEVEGAMKMVEYTCTKAASSASTEKASTALVLAAVHKVLEICQTLVQRIGDGSSNADLLDRSFRLQRLDLALFQGFLFLKRVGQVEALKKVSELHTWIRSIMQQEQYRLIW